VVGRALDLGAAGVIVPLVESPEQAAHAVAACRYPPAGTRSYGPVRVAGDGGESLCVVMCETRAGVEALAAICAVPGLDAVYVGPRDLALSYGLEPGEELDAVIAGIAETCAGHDVPAGIQARSGEDARRWTAAGFRFAAASSERDLLARAAARELAAALGADEAPLAAPPTGVLRAAARYA
jgi:4-hydroxy-2-oxoheptanedioate aldolase